MQARPLEHLRFPVGESRGRRYPELDHPYRNPFQRDRDRIVHARAFRRLEDKTQVFTPRVVDHFRNRLTHTIEVAQISRTVAGVLGLDEDLTETLALAHDIGHPPFAHSAEEELDRLMQRFGERFDHNLQSLRIVESLENRYIRFPGLNLTFEVREGIAKHSRDIEPGEGPELDQYLPGLRPPLEAQLIDLTDEIAYNTADLDDGYSAGMFGIDQVAREIPHYAEIWEAVDTQFAAAPEELRFLEALRALIDWLVTGMIQGTASGALDSGVTDHEGVRQHPQRLAQLTGPAKDTNAALKRFLRQNVYNTEDLVAERRESSLRVAELFEHLLGHPDLLPETEDPAAELPRRVCDYIASMTDGGFRRVYANLLGR